MQLVCQPLLENLCQPDSGPSTMPLWLEAASSLAGEEPRHLGLLNLATTLTRTTKKMCSDALCSGLASGSSLHSHWLPPYSRAVVPTQPFWHQGQITSEKMFPWTRHVGEAWDHSSTLHLPCTLFLI